LQQEHFPVVSALAYVRNQSWESAMVGLVGGEEVERNGWWLALSLGIDNGKKISNNQIIED